MLTIMPQHFHITPIFLCCHQNGKEILAKNGILDSNKMMDKKARKAKAGVETVR